MRKFLALACLFAAILPAECLAVDKEMLNKTNVRVLGDPQGTFRRSRALTLVFVEVEARNVGSVNAENVQVTALVPGGQKVALKGPAVLEPNKVGKYTADANHPIVSTQKLKAEASCSNCW